MGLQSVHHTLSLPLLPPQGRTPHTLPLLWHGLPLTEDSPPQASATGVLPTGRSSSQTAPLWVLPRGAVLQEQAAPAWVPHGVTSPASNPAPAWAPLSAWGHRSCQDLAPARALHGVTAPFGHIRLLWYGFLRGLQVEICSTMDLHGLAGAQPASPWSASRASGENSLLRHLGQLLPLHFH